MAKCKVLTGSAVKGLSRLNDRWWLAFVRYSFDWENAAGILASNVAAAAAAAAGVEAAGTDDDASTITISSSATAANLTSEWFSSAPFGKKNKIIRTDRSQVRCSFSPLQATPSKLLTYSVFRPTQPPTPYGIKWWLVYIVCAMGRGPSAKWGGSICLSSVLLSAFVSVMDDCSCQSAAIP